MIANVIQTNFTSGEVSPLMRGRVDSNKYFGGAKSIQNLLVRPQGGAWRRSGTRLIQAVKTEANYTRLIPFKVSASTVYVLEFGNLYVRVFKNRAPVMSGPQVEFVTPWATADLAALTFTQSADVLYVAHANYQTRKISRTSDTSWSVSLYDPDDGPYLDREIDPLLQLKVTTDSDSTVVHSVASVWSAGDVNKYFTVSLRGNICPVKVTAFTNANQVTVTELPYLAVDPGVDITLQQQGSVNDWILRCDHSGLFSQAVNGHYVMCTSGAFYHLFIPAWTYQDPATMWVGHSTGVVSPVYANFNNWSNARYNDQLTCDKRNVTLDIKTGDSRSMFVSTDVGRWIRLEFAGRIIAAKISSYVSGSNVKAISEHPIPLDEADGGHVQNSGVTTSYRLGAWSTATGWPSIVQLHEQRIWFANNASQPMTLWATVSGDYENFAPSDLSSKVLDTSSLTLVIAANQADPVMWMSSGGVLAVGTEGNEFVVKATNLAEPITPTNVTVPKQTSFGSVKHIPCRAGTTTLVIQRGGNKLRELSYDFQIDQFVSKDITVISEHILRQGGGAVELVIQPEPANYVWARLAGGTLACLTYERDQDVVAWHRHYIATAPSNNYPAVVETICSIPNSGGFDDLYMIVQRQINGSIHRTIEVLETDYLGNSVAGVGPGAVILDACTTVSQLSSVTLSGIPSFMSGEQIYVWNAATQDIEVVSVSGTTATLAQPIATGYMGYMPVAQVEFLPPEGGSPTGGTSQGKVKRIAQLQLRFERSGAFKYGAKNRPLYRKICQDEAFPSVSTDVPSALFSGDMRITLDAPFARDGTIIIQADEHYPLIILAAMQVLNTNE